MAWSQVGARKASMKFDIHHVSARQTVASTEASVEDVEQGREFLRARVEALVAALPESPVVAGSVEALQVEVLDPTSEAVITKTRSATAGASLALNHFSEGDEQMRSTTDSRASSVNAPDMPGGSRS